MSQAQLDAMKSKLVHLKNVSRPRAIKETQEHAANGDFSENAEYQIAKGRLRGINSTITELEFQIPRAIVIKASKNTNVVAMGHTVTVSLNGEKEFTWKILGPTESDPKNNIISHLSPIGAALLGKRVGDVAIVKLEDRSIEYTIKAISQ